MKKIFLLLASVATMSACNTNTGGEDPLITRYKQIGALFYLGTLNQLAYNLDPFDMAFRLNTLITETQNEGGSLDDLNSSALKTRLFGATTITKEGPVYTLSLATIAPDDIRSGTIRINTADGTLKDGHTWTLSLPKDEPYMVSIEGFLASASELLTPAGIPLVVTRGNHDGRGKFARHWLDYFPTPTGESYYTFRRGPVFFVVLDGCEDKPDSDIRYYGLSTTDAYREQEARWLKGVVESEEYRAAPLHIVVLHMIPGGKSSWHGEQEIRRLFVPILNEASVDIMLCGHYHRYQWIDDGSRGTNFPILVNSNRDKLVVKADRRGIDIDVVNTGGEVIKRHRIDK